MLGEGSEEPEVQNVKEHETRDVLISRCDHISDELSITTLRLFEVPFLKMQQIFGFRFFPFPSNRKQQNFKFSSNRQQGCFIRRNIVSYYCILLILFPIRRNSLYRGYA